MQNWMIELRFTKWLVLFLLLGGQLHAQETKNIVILHNNDVHSRIEPMPETHPNYPNLGGIVRQGAYVDEVRGGNENVLLFSCGDFVQGTPYFNLFGGQIEVSCMNFMKYDAACLGNHEFDNGLDRLAKIIRSAQFPIISTNLDFTGTSVEGLTKKYIILERGDIQIGVIGLTIDTKDLVTPANYEGVKYLDPIQVANETAAFLKEEGCDLVVCLSHLGYYPSEDEVGDITLAKESRNIDAILGGHTHTFLNKADRRLNLDEKEVVINQVGDRGINMGRLDIVMESEPEK